MTRSALLPMLVAILALVACLAGCDRAGYGDIAIDILLDPEAEAIGRQPDPTVGVELAGGSFHGDIAVRLAIGSRDATTLARDDGARAGLPVRSIQITESWFLHPAAPINIHPDLLPFVKRNEVRRTNGGWDVVQRIVVVGPVKLVPTPKPVAKSPLGPCPATQGKGV
ncbi:MAG: hypothetical protein BIFFINMI_02971 [Phycisphaerae bacterium]|nr:hypothetical protein [Phycisphaerae bacterium]